MTCLLQELLRGGRHLRKSGCRFWGWCGAGVRVKSEGELPIPGLYSDPVAAQWQAQNSPGIAWESRHALSNSNRWASRSESLKEGKTAVKVTERERWVSEAPRLLSAGQIHVPQCREARSGLVPRKSSLHKARPISNNHYTPCTFFLSHALVQYAIPPAARPLMSCIPILLNATYNLS